MVCTITGNANLAIQPQHIYFFPFVFLFVFSFIRLLFYFLSSFRGHFYNDGLVIGFEHTAQSLAFICSAALNVVCSVFTAFSRISSYTKLVIFSKVSKLRTQRISQHSECQYIFTQFSLLLVCYCTE